MLDLHQARVGIEPDTVWKYSIGMNRDADRLEDVRWIAVCAERLRAQWPRADPTSLEETARQLWQSEALRALPGEEAAEKWLGPLR